MLKVIKTIMLMAVLIQGASAFSKVSDSKNEMIVKHINIAVSNLRK